MIWHIVRFDFSGIDDDVREDVERGLQALDAIDEVAFLRLGRDLADAHVTGLITGFATPDALETYHTHPVHVPVVEAIRAAGIGVTRLDITSDDDPSELPS